ncbi:hypothetical protein PR048_022664 [Dryococelus australis]|uniref:Uncharacterized protein n=1 Tax=Dryococelus australis TaxID=614101 RepID=A0ABQ9H1X2_9NEOP|nr:hypothetical protein PR048_022664 [Dryococelus australis]
MEICCTNTKSSRPSKLKLFCKCIGFPRNDGRGKNVATLIIVIFLPILENIEPSGFLHNCQHPEDKKSDELDVIDLSNTGRHLAKLTQKKSFYGVDDERITPFMPFEDEHGILLIKTKLSECKDVLEFRHPAVLPADHTVVMRLIDGLDVHVESKRSRVGRKIDVSARYKS